MELNMVKVKIHTYASITDQYVGHPNVLLKLNASVDTFLYVIAEFAINIFIWGYVAIQTFN